MRGSSIRGTFQVGCGRSRLYLSVARERVEESVMKCRFSPVFSLLSVQSPFDAHLLDAYSFDTHLPLTRRPFPFHMFCFSHYCLSTIPSQHLSLFILIVISHIIVIDSRLVIIFSLLLTGIHRSLLSFIVFHDHRSYSVRTRYIS